MAAVGPSEFDATSQLQVTNSLKIITVTRRVKQRSTKEHELGHVNVQQGCRSRRKVQGSWRGLSFGNYVRHCLIFHHCLPLC